jgi:hypothetical protein
MHLAALHQSSGSHVPGGKPCPAGLVKNRQLHHLQHLPLALFTPQTAWVPDMLEFESCDMFASTIQLQDVLEVVTLNELLPQLAYHLQSCLHRQQW